MPKGVSAKWGSEPPPPLAVQKAPRIEQETPSSALKIGYRKNFWAAGAPRRTPLGELTTLPQTHGWCGGRIALLHEPSVFGPLGLAKPHH